MRAIAHIFVVVAGICLTVTARAQTKPDSLMGAWIPVTQAMAGKPIPKAVFDKDKLILSDSTYTMMAESIDKGVVKYNGNKMDIYGRQGANAGQHFTAIYKFENGQLTICYNLKGDSYPETFDTAGKPLFFVSVFKKETN